MKKKLNKDQSGSEEGHDHEGHSPSSSSSQQIKGQWERRLQTDIHMAKQALSDALSLNNVSPETKPSPSHASTTYASSYENIARLMENWVKTTPSSVETNSSSGYSISNVVTTGSSSSEGGQSTTTCAQDHAFDYLLTFKLCDGGSRSRSVEENNKKEGIFQDLKTGFETQVPLTLLEKWLCDEGAAQCHEDLINMSLEESSTGLF